MKHNANNQAAEREAQSSSVQSVQMEIEIPADILSPNHRRAYAMAYRAAYQKKHIRFVSDIVRFSIERGWNDGERAYWADADAEAEEILAEETAAEGGPIMNFHAARRYISPRTRALTPQEHETRYISYQLKDPRQWDFLHCVAIAAEEMAALIDGPCNLIPVPSSRGNTEANRHLANAIAARVKGARVVDGLRRTQTVPSSCERHKAKRGGLPVRDHHLERDWHGWVEALPTYFVDNTSTSGNTLRAARAAFHFGSGLVFSDASPNR